MKSMLGTHARTARGFTLLELMVALTLAGMMLAAGLPSFITFLRNAEVRSTSEAISNGLRLARSEATRLNRPVSFTFAGGNDPSWAINIFNPATGALLQPPIQQYSKLEVGRSAMVVRSPVNARRDHVQRPRPHHFAVADRDAEPAAGRRALDHRRRGAHAAHLRRRRARHQAVRSRSGAAAADAARREGC